MLLKKREKIIWQKLCNKNWLTFLLSQLLPSRILPGFHFLSFFVNAVCISMRVRRFRVSCSSFMVSDQKFLPWIRKQGKKGSTQNYSSCECLESYASCLNKTFYKFRNNKVKERFFLIVHHWWIFVLLIAFFVIAII